MCIPNRVQNYYFFLKHTIITDFFANKFAYIPKKLYLCTRKGLEICFYGKSIELNTRLVCKLVWRTRSSGWSSVLPFLRVLRTPMGVLYQVLYCISHGQESQSDTLAWSLLSIFVSPLLTWILLLIIGDKK